MNQCIDEGRLRAYLDAELPEAVRNGIDVHVANCRHCQDNLVMLQATSLQAARLLAMPAPEPAVALARFRAVHRHGKTAPALLRSSSSRSTTIMTARQWFSRHPLLNSGVAVVALALALLAFPAVRAAADQLLQVFRVQSVILMPVQYNRIQELRQLNFDANTLFVARPTVVNQPASPRTVNTAGEATGAVGFDVKLPSALPGKVQQTHIVVRDHEAYRFQVNIEAGRRLLSLLNITDVTLPDSLGSQPITAELPPWVVATVSGATYSFDLYQGHTPSVNMPTGVSLRQLGKAALRLLGSSPQQAETLSRQIDWSSTLILPFPADVSDVRQVTVNGAPGIMVKGGSGENRGWMLYWQHADHFYVLQGHGAVLEPDMLAAAESIH